MLVHATDCKTIQCPPTARISVPTSKSWPKRRAIRKANLGRKVAKSSASRRPEFHVFDDFFVDKSQEARHCLLQLDPKRFLIMKKSVLLPIIFTVALASLARFTQAAPLGTAFTYEGHLTASTNAANGHYDFTFKLFDAISGPTQHGMTLTNPSVVVAKGLFTTELDFGAGIFDGTAYWLEIGVRTNGGGSFTNLFPRQPVTPSPYAIFSPSAGTAATAGSASSVAANGVNGS